MRQRIGGMRAALALAGVVALMTVTVAPAAAITDGSLDGDGHPYVGLMVAQLEDGTPLWRCSGTLISPTVFLTAGHCTEAPAVHAEIWFDADVQSGIPANGYPVTGEVGGTTYTHPQYDPNAFFLYDLGVVVLDEAVNVSEYGVLPELDQLDGLKTMRGNQDVTFTAVGYGLQESFPDAAGWKDVALRQRMVAHPKLNQINGGIVGDYSLLLSNNAKTGGTCFGDSGGPHFWKRTLKVVAVTSWGDAICRTNDMTQRLDIASAVDFLEDHGL